jgi:hypothetical protein
MDMSWTAFIWGVCGVAALVIGVAKAHEIPARFDAYAFNFILTPPLLWALTYVWSLTAYLITDGMQGRLTSATALIIYALIVCFVVVIAGWPEVTKEIIVPARLPDEKESPNG